MRRLILVLATVLLAGCGSIVSETFSNVGEELSTPSPDDESTPSASPSAEAEDAGRFVVVNVGGPVDGPGMSLDEAIGAADGQPKLVTGVLLMDTEGIIWLCDEVTESSPPECGEPRLQVANYPEGGAEWNIEDAELTGLQEADGVLWFEDGRLYGVIES